MLRSSSPAGGHNDAANGTTSRGFSSVSASVEGVETEEEVESSLFMGRDSGYMRGFMSSHRVGSGGDAAKEAGSDGDEQAGMLV